MESHWNIQTLSAENQRIADRLAGEMNISPLVASMFVRRGFTTRREVEDFLHPSPRGLHNPLLMRDMDLAVARLSKAIRLEEKIMIYGDYDVDGTTAVSLVYKFLHSFYSNLEFYIPDRYSEGYGISFQGIDHAALLGCKLIIALDCGIKSVDKVAYAQDKGIDFIICDHHTPGDELPAAVAVLDPHRADCPYPYKDLCGCGVGFKLLQAYAQLTDKLKLLNPLMGLLAMSIASDIVSLTGENRVLASYGLKQLNSNPSVGLQAIMENAGIAPGEVTMNDLVYKIGPRVNACGRMKSGADAVRLLITEDADEARELAATVEDNNMSRKNEDQQVFHQAEEMLRSSVENDKKYATVVCGDGWHKGVIGIVASRLIEVWYRPTIVLSRQDGMVGGSARSVADFDIYSAIDSCRDLLTHFGGHPFAAGLAMPEENYPEFCRRFEEYVAAHIRPSQLRPTIDVEAEVLLSDITQDLYDTLLRMEPFGPGNPRPIFVTRHLINYRNTRAVGKEKNHLHLNLTDRETWIDGIGFGLAKDWEMYLRSGKPADVCYRIGENTYKGTTTIQMLAEDIKPCTTNEY